MSKKAAKKRKKSKTAVTAENESVREVADVGASENESPAEQVTSDELQVDSVTEGDLDEEVPELDKPEVASKGSDFAIKATFGARIHDINIRFPWLKVVLLLFLVVISAVGMEEILRHNVQRLPVETVTEEQAPADPVEQSEVPEVIETPETEKKEDTTAQEEQPAVQPAPAPETPQPPAPQPQASSGRKLIALTFDDGPSPAQTPRLLQILAEKNVKVTFFALGSMAVKSPDVLRSEAAGGHEVASHTMTHANLIKSPIETIQWEVAATNETFVNILGVGPKLTRPPYGNINANVRTYVNQPLILWSVDPEDWKYRNTATVRANVVGAAFDGAIVLLHDIHATTVDAVPGIIDDLRAAGYEFMTVSELAAARGIVMTPGASYGSFRP